MSAEGVGSRHAGGHDVLVSMRLITIDDDVYRHLVRNARELGDTPTVILRRLLGIDAPGPRVRRVPPLARRKAQPEADHELAAALDRNPWLPFEVQRYLYLLRCIQQLRPLDFRNVLQIRGRERLYFARTAREIESSGKATQPRAIPGSGYWALTNLPAREKERILRSAMTMLTFDENTMLATREYLLRGRIPSMPG